MTPKEKAEDLVNKFMPPTQSWFEIEQEWRDDHELSKKAALIAVDEILSLRMIHIMSRGNNIMDSEGEFYESVKEEIKKL